MSPDEENLIVMPLETTADVIEVDRMPEALPAPHRAGRTRSSF